MPYWNRALGNTIVWPFAIISLLIVGCNSSADTVSAEPVAGCDGQIYIDPATSPYVLPYAVGETFETGLTNCSSSYHAAGQPDQYAFDFDMPSARRLRPHAVAQSFWL